MIGAPSLSTNQKREQIAGPPFAATAADNGLSVDPVTAHIVLGQDPGAAGDPGRILTPREIPYDPATSIEMRAGSIFGTGGQSLIGLLNDSANSFIPFVMTLEQLAQLPSANLVCRAVTANGGGAAIQMHAEIGSGRLTVNGRNASIPAALQDAFVMNSNDNNTSLGFVTGHRAGGRYFSYWGTDGAGVAQEYYRILPPVLSNLNFGNTAAQTSADIIVTVTGARDGDQVALGVPNSAMANNCMYSAWVSANDSVTVRFNNYSAAAIDPGAGNFKIGVTRLLP